MVGYGANKGTFFLLFISICMREIIIYILIIMILLLSGVIPITCEELFKGIENKRTTSNTETFEVGYLDRI